MAPPPRERRLQHPRRRHLPAGHRTPSCQRPRRRRPGVPRLARVHRPVLPQRALEAGAGTSRSCPDKWFLQNYRIRSESLSALYLKEAISTLYLQGQGDRSFFDVRGYYFQGLSTYDWQKQQPVVHPVLDYNKRIDGPRRDRRRVRDRRQRHEPRPARPPVPADAAVSGHDLFGLYETCSVFERGVCLVRGISGTYTRASTQAVLAARLHRPRRPGLDALRLCAGRRLLDRSRLRRLPERPAHQLHRRRRRGLRSAPCRPSARIPLPVRGPRHVGHADPRADRADHRAPERDPDRPPAERGRPEPRVRRHLDLRLGQVLRLRPRRGRRARQYRPAIQRHRATTASTPTRCSASPTSSPGATRSGAATSSMSGRDSGLDRAAPTMSAASRSRRTRT